MRGGTEEPPGRVVEPQIDHVGAVDAGQANRKAVEQEANRLQPNSQEGVVGGVQARVVGGAEVGVEVERPGIDDLDADIDGQVVVQAIPVRVDARIQMRREENRGGLFELK